MLPPVAALAAAPGGAVLLTPDGEIESLSLPQAARHVRGAEPPMVCHARAVAARLRTEAFPAFDLLELFAFIRPAQFCVPTPRGLAEALKLPAPRNHEEEAETLPAAARALLEELATRFPRLHPSKQSDLKGIAWVMAKGG